MLGCRLQVVSALLQHGQGLWLGPDCDGLLNFCDGSESTTLPAASVGKNAGGGGGNGGGGAAAARQAARRRSATPVPAPAGGGGGAAGAAAAEEGRATPDLAEALVDPQALVGGVALVDHAAMALAAVSARGVSRSRAFPCAAGMQRCASHRRGCVECTWAGGQGAAAASGLRPQARPGPGGCGCLSSP